MTQDLSLLSAVELSTLYRAGKASPVETTRAVLKQIEDLNPVLNAFCWLDIDAAMDAARSSEDRWKRGEPKSLVDGIPTTVKDLSVTRGWPTRRGSRAIPARGPWLEDSPSVARMREAGAVLIGKTTVPEFGSSGCTKSDLCGVTRNPWNPAKSPGGSSGGASASLAAGMGTIALGSDAAGSIRSPASHTATFGLKTTFGRVPDYPSSYLGTIAVVGPMTRTVADAALCMNVISQPDSRDSYALPPPTEDFSTMLAGGIKGLRIAYSPTLGHCEIDPEVAAIVADGAKLLEQLGANVEQVERIFDDPSEYLFKVMGPGMTNAFRVFGFTEADKALMNPRLVQVAEANAKMPVAEFIAARDRQEQLGALMRKFHEKYDLLVTPSCWWPPIGAEDEAPTDPRYSRLKAWMPLCATFNLTKQPAASVPLGLTADGLPVGMQVVGPLYSDALVMRACHTIEMARAFARPNLDLVRKFPVDSKTPRGIASMLEAQSELAAA